MTTVAKKRAATKKTSTPSAPPRRAPKREPEHEADGYGDLHRSVARPVLGDVFATSATDLFETFLKGLPARRRQHYACNACRRFVDTFGGLVRITNAGDQKPAIWPDDGTVPSFFHDAIDAVRYKIARAKVTGVFLSSAHTWGTPVTPPWQHLHALNPTPFRVVALRNAFQAMAEKREEHGMLLRGLAEFSMDTVEQAVRLLKSEALYRSEKCLGVATWLLDLHRARAAATGTRAKDNVVWLAVASAPVGFAHVRSTMIGTLLEDIAGGMSFEAVSKRFAEKMHPLQYQRPTAPPSEGQLVRAEKVVGELEAAGALRRRFARLQDLRALWTPQPKNAPAATAGGGVFAHLRNLPKDRSIEIPPVTMTWEKFQRTVLPEAAEIEWLVPHRQASFSAFVTAVDPDAPPILQWDDPADRNPVSWYFYHGGSPARQWGLIPGAWARVTAIALKPSMWGARPLAHHGDGFFLMLAGAKDSRAAGLALFPETLKSDFHEIRKTIEAFSNRGEIEGRDDGDACGIGYLKGQEWAGDLLRVTARDGGIANFKLDRWD